MDDERPIGWWVKRLDTLLEEALDSVVAGEGLTRRHWQLLHSLAGMLRRTLHEEMRAMRALERLTGDAAARPVAPAGAMVAGRAGVSAEASLSDV